MKPSHHPVQSGMLLLLVLLSSSLTSLSQETNGLTRSNALPVESKELVPTNTLVQTNVATPPNGFAPTNHLTNSLEESNHFIQTNRLLSTNELAPGTNDLAQTNDLPQGTNHLVQETNDVPRIENSTLPDHARPAESPRRLDYASFRIITDRNIFNPNRSSYRPRTERRETRRPSRTESFSLVGTMSYDKGLLAFFDGTGSEYRKAAKLADEIAGYKITDIGYNHVKLATTTNEIELPIGMQMRREDEGDWNLVAQSGAYATSTSAATSSSASPSDTSAVPGTAVSSSAPGESSTNTVTESSSAGSESDILKKLMQRREEQLNK